jgi:hypothetical protein
MSADERVAAEITGLGDLPRSELAARWQAVYGQQPPKGAKRVLLERAFAWHLQAEVAGGLSKDLRKALTQAAVEPGSLGGEKTPSCLHRQSAARTRTRRSLPSPGARLVRQWRGRTHIIDVLDNGYVWEGRAYRSLSIIARAITGAHWSGPRFFGL